MKNFYSFFAFKFMINMYYQTSEYISRLHHIQCHSKGIVFMKHVINTTRNVFKKNRRRGKNNKELHYGNVMLSLLVTS